MKTLTVALFLLSFNLVAKDFKIDGMVCDKSDDGKVKIEIVTKQNNVSYLRFQDPFTLRYLGQIAVSSSAVASALRGDLASLDQKTFTDKVSGASVSFKIDGYTHDRKATLSAEYTGKTFEMQLDSCRVSTQFVGNPL